MSELQRISHQAMMTLPAQSRKESLALTLAKNGSSEVSIFAGSPASVQHIAISVKKLSTAFPQMSKEFFNLLTERIAKTGMSSQRLEYAVNKVIDNFIYKQLTIADILSMDVKCRLLSYSEMCNEVAKNGSSTDQYAPVYLSKSERPAWVLKVDKLRYGIPDKMY